MKDIIGHKSAYFIPYPRQLEDMNKLYAERQTELFVIEKTIALSKIEYENFIMDLCVLRWFIEENAHICRVDERNVWHCLNIGQKKRRQSILVMSDGTGFAKYAAIYMRQLI